MTGFDPKRQIWTIEVPGGSAFALNAAAVCAREARDRKPGPTRDVFERLAHAFVDASPEYDDDRPGDDPRYQRGAH